MTRTVQEGFPVAKVSILLAGMFAVLTSISSHARSSNGVASENLAGAEVSDETISRRFAGAGGWRSEAAPMEKNRPWRLHAVTSKDGSVKAKLSVLGIPGFEDLTVEGQVIERDAFGVLLDEKGQQVATFNAKLSADGNGGSFILGNGESGTWEYDERTKAELSAVPSDSTKVE